MSLLISRSLQQLSIPIPDHPGRGHHSVGQHLLPAPEIAGSVRSRWSGALGPVWDQFVWAVRNRSSGSTWCGLGVVYWFSGGVSVFHTNSEEL